MDKRQQKIKENTKLKENAMISLLIQNFIYSAYVNNLNF